MKAKKIAPAVGLAGLLLVGLVAGCSHNASSSLPTGEQQQANRLDQIVSASGGDWNKLSPADRDYLVKTLAQGNMQTAHMLLKIRSGAGGGPSHPAPRS